MNKIVKRIIKGFVLFVDKRDDQYIVTIINKHKIEEFTLNKADYLEKNIDFGDMITLNFYDTYVDGVLVSSDMDVVIRWVVNKLGFKIIYCKVRKLFNKLYGTSLPTLKDLLIFKKHKIEFNFKSQLNDE